MWRPHYLHPDTPEGCARNATRRAKAERRDAWLKEMAPDQYAHALPGKRQFSFLAFEALEFACDHGRDFAFKTAAYDLMWTEGHDIGEPETLMVAGERSKPIRRQCKLHCTSALCRTRTRCRNAGAREIGATAEPPGRDLPRQNAHQWLDVLRILQQVMENRGMQPR
jgi:hypothetical protein